MESADEPKKRGRKRKDDDAHEEIKVKKKRGRKASMKYFNSSIRNKIIMNPIIEDPGKHILNLPLCETTGASPVVERAPLTERATGEVTLDLQRSIETGTTALYCWWCAHPFDCEPVRAPIYYTGEKYLTDGIFCSFSCAKAYIHDNPYEFNESVGMYINNLYKRMTGITVVPSLKEYRNELEKRYAGRGEKYIDKLMELVTEPLGRAPPRRALAIFGGNLSIDQFRAAVPDRKKYKSVKYPMTVSRNYIEELDIPLVKSANKSVFASKAPEPEKRTIASFIKFS